VTIDKENFTISAIAAIGNQRQIGKNNELLWDIPADLKRFQKLTDNKAVIMGRRTWESLPGPAQPLPNRKNIILTRNEDYDADSATILHGLDEALSQAKYWSQKNGQIEVFIIGGESVYSIALTKTDKLYLTIVDSDADGDTFFPQFRDEFNLIGRKKHREHNPPFDFCVFERV
jgi:dihydrofolate reductase